MTRVVADLGNSRLKWGRLGPDGTIAATAALPLDDPDAWGRTFDAWNLDEGATEWAVSTVNPPVADRLETFLADRGIRSIRWFRSAADVPVRHALEHASTTGADRALAVLAAIGRNEPGRAGAVVSCGTAVTVERIAPDGTWQGGAIAPGLSIAAKALHGSTAQLPRIAVFEAPESWGKSTGPAMAAGIYWGTVGAIRELLTRQAEGLDPPPWLVWTGGDAPALAMSVEGPGAHIIPDLVLIGLALAAFGGPAR